MYFLTHIVGCHNLYGNICNIDSGADELFNCFQLTHLGLPLVGNIYDTVPQMYSK